MDSSRAIVSPARSVAFAVLQAVNQGANASDSLLELATGLETRDAGLATQLVFGSLRFQAQLDAVIARLARRPPAGIDPVSLAALRLGVFQLRHLDRVPPHAAVHETVELTKQFHPRGAGLVNAILRRVDRKPIRWAEREVRLSCPRWLLDRWQQHFGRWQAEAIAQAALAEPDRYIRVPPGRPLPAHLQLAATEIAGCYRVENGAVEPGQRFHDIGSQSVAGLLELQPGMSYLDLCAAPGNKTLQALEARPGLAVACDLSLRRMRHVPAGCPRVVLDAARPLPFRRRFARILVDAPCTGTGTIGRNPEIKWRVQEQDVDRLARLQRSILGQALPLLEEGGLLVYATCSLEREENEGVVNGVLGNLSGYRVIGERWRLPGREPGDGFYTAVIRSDKFTPAAR